MRDSGFSSIDDYMSEPTAEDYNDSTISTGASFGMGSGDGIDSSNRRTMGNAGDFTIGIDPSNITNFIGPLSGNNNVPNVFDLGGGVGDFGFGNTRSQNFLNPQLAEMYKQQEIARTGADLNKNPFAPNIFDAIAKAFGTSVDRTKDLGSQRVQEINDLRARQAFGLPSLNTGLSYTSKDFEAGRDTNQGMVRELPVGGIESFARAVLPGSSLLPRGAAPEQSQMYREAQAKANAPGIIGSLGGIANQFGRDVSAGAKQIQNDLIQLADGAMSYLSNKGKAGDTVENIVAEQNKLQGPPLPPSQFDQFGNMVRSSIYDYSGNPTEPLSVIQNRRNKIEDLQQNASEVAQLREQGTDPNFIPNTFPTIDRTNVLNNSFMDSGASLATDAEGIASLRPSIAQLSEDRKKQNALNTIFDMLNKDTQNIEIAAGANTGKTLNTALPERRDLNAFTSPGYLQTSNKYTLDEMLNRDLSRPQQGPPERPKKAPPGFVDITIDDSDRPSVFAGTNMPITGGKTIGSKLYSPANELELKAKTDAGFDLYPTPFNFFENTSFAEAESKPGVRLSPASYIFDPGKDEKGTTVRVPISSLPNMEQEVNSLRTDLDYGTSFPLQTILDGRKAINQGQFSQKEMSDFLAGFN